MSGLEDPTGGWAKATEETAKTGRKGLVVLEHFGSFISGPIRESIGILEDHLKFVRYKRQVRLADRTEEFMRDRGLDAPTRQIPLNIAVPLITHAALEEDDELQDHWAMLFANAADKDCNIEMRRAFVSMLSEMTSLDIRIISKIYDVSKDKDTDVFTANLPEAALPTHGRVPEGMGVIGTPPKPDVAISLGNLFRLGCIRMEAMGGNMSGPKWAGITHLGLSFVKACSKPKKE